MSTNFWPSLILVVLLNTIVSCTSAPLSKDIKRSVSGIMSYETRWTKPEVRICWGRKEHISKICRTQGNLPSHPELPPPVLQARLQELVEREFSKERTGIYFTGWQICGDDLAAIDAILLTGEEDGDSEARGWASIGQCGEEAGTDVPIRRLTEGKSYASLRYPKGLVNNSNEKQMAEIEATFLHEMTHLAGLQHEILSVDENRFNEPGYWSSDYGVPATSSDSVSIMSYEWLNIIRTRGTHFRTNRQDESVRHDPLIVRIQPAGEDQIDVSLRVGLSSGDVHALRCLYVYDDETKRTNCRMGIRPWK